MAQKVLLKDVNKNEILPITRGELVLDSSGKQALHSDEFLATTSQPGLMSKEDKYKIDNISISTLEITDLLPNGKKIATVSVGSTSYNILAPASYNWDEINNKPTKLSQFTDDVVAGKYLPLSGGTISGNLTVGADSASTTNQYYLRMWKEENSQRHRAMLYVDAEGTSLSYYNKTSGLFTQLKLGASSYKIGTANTLYDIIHSGNIGSYAFIPRADKLISKVDADNYWSNGAYLNQTGNGSGNSNFPNNYAMFLSFNNGVSNYVTQFDMGRGAAYYRTKIDTWSKWYQFITDENIGSQSVNYATSAGYADSAGNADTVDGYHATSLWRSDGATWNPGANVTMTPTANGQEFSFDFRSKGRFTGAYWHVWDESKSTLLKVDADSGAVSAPYGFVGNLTGKASALTDLNTNDAASATATKRKIWFSYDDGVTGRPALSDNLTFQVSTSTLFVPHINGKITIPGGSYSWYQVQQYNSSNGNPSYYSSDCAIININSYTGWQPWIRGVDSENGSWTIGQYTTDLHIGYIPKTNTSNALTYRWDFAKDGSTYFPGSVIVPTGPIWVQGGSAAGSNSNRLTTTSGMPTSMQYNTNKRGTQIYANGIAFCDPYNGNSNNDSGWIRHLETTANNGVLEIAMGDDAANEEIRFRYYNTSNNIAYDILVPRATGTLALTSQIPTVTDYYWADQLITNSAKSDTTPTFGSVVSTGLITAKSGIQIGSTSDIGWYFYNSRICAGNSVARGVNAGSLLVSNAWADDSKVPTNGIYSKGNIITPANVQASVVYANRPGSSTSGGVSLYSTTDPDTYGIMFRGTANGGKHGAVTGDWATYFTMNDDATRGWIFRKGSTNVASISGGGIITANYLDLRGASTATMTYASTNPYIVFSEQGGQCVKLLYSDYDSYRSPAGLKVIGDQGGEWFEVVGQIYASGGYPVITSILDGNGYPALLTPSGSSNWIRISNSSSYGLLPNQSGSAGSGHGYIGTSSWYFKYAYIDNIYGYLNGNISGNAATADKALANSLTSKTENECVPSAASTIQHFICSNSTTGGGDGYIQTYRWSSGNYLTQIYYDVDSTYNVSVRHRDSSGNWNAWKQVAYTSDIPTIPSITISNSGSGNAVTSITASGHTVTVTKGKNFFTHLGTDNKASVWSWGTVSGTSGWNSTASDRGYRGQYGTNLDISGFSTWYHRFAMCTDGRVEYWHGINTKTLTKLGVIAWTSEIPTVTNYYWADVKISATSSTTTSPTVNSIKSSGYSLLGQCVNAGDWTGGTANSSILGSSTSTIIRSSGDDLYHYNWSNAARYKILDSNNSSVSGGGSSWGSSITVKINGTSKTLTIPSNPNTDSSVYQSSTTTSNYRPVVLGMTSTTSTSSLNTATTGQVYVSTKFYVQPSTGSFYATAFYESSDEHLKDFENDINIDFNTIKAIPKKYFRWKERPYDLQIGTSAQVVQKFYPELVSSSVDGYLSVDYSKLSVIALKGIDELYDMIMELRAENRQLREQIRQLQK